MIAHLKIMFDTSQIFQYKISRLYTCIYIKHVKCIARTVMKMKRDGLHRKRVNSPQNTRNDRTAE